MDDSKDVAVSTDVKKTLLQWLLGQESNTVALYLLFAAILYGGYLAATVVVPKQLQMINDGREKDAKVFTDTIKDEAEKNRAAHKEIAERHYAAVKDMTENFRSALKESSEHGEKMMETVQRAFENGARVSNNGKKD